MPKHIKLNIIGLLVIAICASSFAIDKSKEIANILKNPALLDLNIESLINKEKQEQQKDKIKSLNALINGYLLFEQLEISKAQEQLNIADNNKYVRDLVKEETGLNIDELTKICTDYFLSVKKDTSEVAHSQDCPYCNGIGYSPCNKCKGRGTLLDSNKQCTECTGLGIVICKECQGTGIIKVDSQAKPDKNLSKDDNELTKIRKLIEIAVFLADGGPDFFTADALRITPAVGK